MGLSISVFGVYFLFYKVFYCVKWTKILRFNVPKSTFDLYIAAKYDLIYIGIIVVKINWARNVDVV
jgi:hypothetical protein